MSFLIHTDCADPVPHTWGPVPETYDEDYFLRGKAKGISNYENYRWMPEQTFQHAIFVERHLRMSKGESVLDFACARGYFVKAMRMLGYKAWGIDISRWAIENCHPDVKAYCLRGKATSVMSMPSSFDWVVAKDVFEHIPEPELEETVKALSQKAQKGMLVIVPLSLETGGRYVREEDEMDQTHVNRWTLSDWLVFLHRFTEGFTVSGGYAIRGLKECCRAEDRACGFITLTKLES